MKVSDVLQKWQDQHTGNGPKKTINLSLSLYDAAKIQALTEMFPGLTIDTILQDLISASLADVTNQFPYIAGSKIISYDEDGNPVHEDIGMTPTFLKLSRHYLKELNTERDPSRSNSS